MHFGFQIVDCGFGGRRCLVGGMAVSLAKKTVPVAIPRDHATASVQGFSRYYAERTILRVLAPLREVYLAFPPITEEVGWRLQSS